MGLSALGKVCAAFGVGGGGGMLLGRASGSRPGLGVLQALLGRPGSAAACAGKGPAPLRPLPTASQEAQPAPQPIHEWHPRIHLDLWPGTGVLAQSATGCYRRTFIPVRRCRRRCCPRCRCWRACRLRLTMPPMLCACVPACRAGARPAGAGPEGPGRPGNRSLLPRPRPCDSRGAAAVRGQGGGIGSPRGMVNAANMGAGRVALAGMKGSQQRSTSSVLRG